MAPGATILGCAGEALTAEERRFFADADPLGFILFRRNCTAPDQVRALVDQLRDAVGRAEAPVLIDQEGGRVARLQPPFWRPLPAAAPAGRLFAAEPDAGRELAHLLARLTADMLHPLGIDVNCAPVLDVLHPAARDPIIGDRAFSREPAVVAELGAVYARGLMAGGVLPVAKHIPGHGRADADSHFELPVVAATEAELDAFDLAPFRALAGVPMAMTAHILYPAWDAERAATLSPVVVGEVIRNRIGFDGLLMTDDLSMRALRGTLGERTAAALEAGCDVALHCNGRPGEMAEVVAAAGRLDANGMRRWRAARALLRPPFRFDAAEGWARLGELLARAGSAA
ncbi:MAG: beta-N-acetylhexosaminidase [Alphaproteobacteria bacterium]